MDLHNSFDVPLPPDQAWGVLLDIPRIAPCMPGAELTEKADDKTYKGKVSVRLGPVALAFAGTAVFEEVDPAGHRAKVSAQGADSKGRGGANAQVTFRLEPKGSGSTVVIDTNLNLSGSVAQYGRGTGMIQSVANQLIGQFAKNLEAELQRSPVGGPVIASPGLPDGSGSESRDAQIAPRTTAAAAPAKPISGFTLIWLALVDVLKGLFGGRKGR